MTALPTLPTEWGQINFPGQRVTVEKGGPTGYVASGWAQGLPVARRPITAAVLNRLLRDHPHTFR